jgi:hypothetical protein
MPQGNFSPHAYETFLQRTWWITCFIARYRYVSHLDRLPILCFGGNFMWIFCFVHLVACQKSISPIFVSSRLPPFSFTHLNFYTTTTIWPTLYQQVNNEDHRCIPNLCVHQPTALTDYTSTPQKWRCVIILLTTLTATTPLYPIMPSLQPRETKIYFSHFLHTSPIYPNP